MIKSKKHVFKENLTAIRDSEKLVHYFYFHILLSKYLENKNNLNVDPLNREGTIP